MIYVRRSDDRGAANHGWLDTKHTFSFADYRDPRFMGFSALRVINEDKVAPGQGFPTHPHRDMEIVTYILDGALEHKDSMGTGSVIEPGDIQRMSAGTGVTHSEFNASKTKPVHLLQIWIEPNQKKIPPSYEQKKISPNGTLTLIAGPEAGPDNVVIHQDARILVARLKKGVSATHRLRSQRKAWVQIARGSLLLNGKSLHQGDGAGISEEEMISLSAPDEAAEALIFDLP
jgi:redox-sensitive bicupin YhaK (pirin superfamily)